MRDCGCGLSGVILGLIVVYSFTSNIEQYSIFGLFPVPAKIYAWALLILLQLLFPTVSFVGHLSGILVRSGFSEWRLKSCQAIVGRSIDCVEVFGFLDAFECDRESHRRDRLSFLCALE